MLTVSRNQLRAATHCAATKDIRYYLVGVHIERAACGDAHIVATDGSILFAGLIAQAQSTQTGPWCMTIPLDVVKRESKGKGEVHLSALPDGRYMLGATVFVPVDGKFPDWRRVSPSRQLIEVTPIECAQFDADLLTRCTSALREWHNGSAKFCPYLTQRGNQAAVMTGTDMTGFCVVMPRRSVDGEGVFPFTPAAYEAAA